MCKEGLTPDINLQY